MNTQINLNKRSALSDYEGMEMSFTAQLCEPSQSANGKTSCVMLIKEGPFGCEGEKLLLNISSETELRCSALYDFTCFVSMPKGVRNPGGSDYALYLRSKHIYSLGSCSEADISFREMSSLPFGINRLYAFRENVEALLDDRLGQNEAALLKGLLFGSDEMSSESTEAFRLCGLSHILAVSGLHAGIVYLFLSFVLKSLKLNEKVSFFIIFVGLFAYCALSCFSVSVFRACLMLSFVRFAHLQHRSCDIVNSASLSALLVLLISPLKLFTASFVLSFSCMAAIAFIYPVMFNKLIKFLKGGLLKKCLSFFCMCVSVNIFLIPLSAHYFQSISLVSLFSNAMVVPLLSLVMLLAFVAVMISFAFPLLSAAVFIPLKLLLSYFGAAARFFSALPFAMVSVRAPRGFAVLLYYLVLFAAFGYINFKKKEGRRLFAMYLSACAVLFFVEAAPFFGEKVFFLDVGQGDCCYISAFGVNVLIDTGREQYTERVILPFLDAAGVYEIDCLVLTHSDADHCAGAFELMQNINIGCIIMNEDESDAYFRIKEEAQSLNIRLKEAYGGDIINVGKLKFEVLSPAFSNANEQSSNERSMVLSFELNETGFVLLADAEGYAIEELIGDSSCINADIVKASHHGGYDKQLAQFYDELNMRYMVISVGDNNYALPNYGVIDICESDDVACFRTDYYGCIVVTTKAMGRFL